MTSNDIDILPESLVDLGHVFRLIFAGLYGSMMIGRCGYVLQDYEIGSPTSRQNGIEHYMPNLQAPILGDFEARHQEDVSRIQNPL